MVKGMTSCVKPAQKNSRRCRLGTFYAFRMIMGNLGGFCYVFPTVFRPTSCARIEPAIHYPCAGRDPHCRTVAPGVIRLTVIGMYPAPESPAVPGVWIKPSPLLVCVNKIVGASAVHYRICWSDRHNCIIGKKTVIAKQRKILCFDIVPFVDRAYYVTYDCPQHYTKPPRFLKSSPICWNVL